MGTSSRAAVFKNRVENADRPEIDARSTRLTMAPLKPSSRMARSSSSAGRLRLAHRQVGEAAKSAWDVSRTGPWASRSLVACAKLDPFGAVQQVRTRERCRDDLLGDAVRIHVLQTIFTEICQRIAALCGKARVREGDRTSPPPERGLENAPRGLQTRMGRLRLMNSAMGGGLPAPSSGAASPCLK